MQQKRYRSPSYVDISHLKFRPSPTHWSIIAIIPACWPLFDTIFIRCR